MQVLIVEDEILLAKRLQKLLLETEATISIAAITQSVQETVNWLHNHPAPDLILMDIELADGQSFDIFNQADIKTPVIFATAYDEYALRAFKVNSIDYLLKPIKKDELKAALEKFKLRLPVEKTVHNIDALLDEIKRLQQPVEYRSRFLVKQGQKMISIETAEIAYIFSENGCSFLRTHQNKKYIIDHTLDELELSLSPKHFFRANRQFILTNKSVIAIHTWFNQKLKVEVKPEAAEHVVISRDKANGFKEWMGE